MVLPVREIGDVIFADFFRQIFAGVRVQALPFFQRCVIRQRDGKTKLRASLLEQLPEARDQHCIRLGLHPKKRLPRRLPILCQQ